MSADERPLAANSQYDHRAAMTCWHFAGMLNSPFVTAGELPQSLDAPEILPRGSVQLRSAGSDGDAWSYLSALGAFR